MFEKFMLLSQGYKLNYFYYAIRLLFKNIKLRR